MNTSFKIHFLLPVLVIAIGSALAGPLAAQALMNLHSLKDRDGTNPIGFLVLSDNTLYGTANLGGTANKGSVFALKADGTGFTNLHSFIGSDGANPYGGVILLGNTLYGTTSGGGGSGNGTVFKINIDGTGFTNLHNFGAGSGSYPSITNTDGVGPSGELASSGETLYGTAVHGGSAGNGTLFAVSTNGMGFTNLHSFGADEGYSPNSLLLSGKRIYGTTGSGINNGGTVFAVNTDGTGFTNLHSLSGADGQFPHGGLLLSGMTLYGTTSTGGASNYGTVFAINTDGTGFTILHSFSGQSDGSRPSWGLVLWGNTLYGTAYSGGSANQGVVFAVNTDGMSFTTLYNFNLRTNGTSYPMNPFSGLTLLGNTLYGTTFGGGTSRAGTIFSITLDIQLSITPYAGDLILTWPSIPSGFTLQATTNLFSPVWRTISPGPVKVNGQQVVIDHSSGTQQFFRLSQ